MRNVWNDYGVFFSEKFCTFFADKVDEIMKRETGLIASTKIGLSMFKPTHGLPMYEKGEISVIRTAISILPEFIDNINFYWKAKSGKIISTTDETFDEDDLEYWIEGLKPALYWEQVSSTVQNHPFQKDLPFRLIVQNFGVLMNLNIDISDTNEVPLVKERLQNLIENFNRRSEEKNRKNGVVHNYSFQECNHTVTLNIDLGSAGIPFVKKILKNLADNGKVDQVMLDL